MSQRILITGGAGFVGSHLADELIAHGYSVRVLDDLSPQVHGAPGRRPAYLHPDAELIRGDIADRDVVAQALEGVDAVYHFAAKVGVGQSMYTLVDYTRVNNVGTATLLEALMKRPVARLVVASSMSIYGEGRYRAPDGRYHDGVTRAPAQLKAGVWEPTSAEGEPLTPVPTPESKRPALASVYALSKYDQERMCLLVGGAYGIEAVALRFFNIYGPRQALSNPYTGVLAIFAARFLNDKPPLVFEDGAQKRDFVSVHDVARASRLALERAEAVGRVFNIGSGQAYTIRGVAERMARVLGKHIEPEITQEYRIGDIRHCFADIGLARECLGFEPRITLEQGLGELAAWLEGQQAEDRISQAREELVSRGLTV